MKKGKGFPRKRPHAQSWLGNKFRPGFRGYPIATVAFYGPNDTLATKVVVSVILTKNNQADFLKRWLSEGELDVSRYPIIGEQVLAFLKTLRSPLCRGDRQDYRLPPRRRHGLPGRSFLPAVSLLGRARPFHTRAYSLSGKNRVAISAFLQDQPSNDNDWCH